ncbi:MAG: cytochrome c biogenesis protein CcsA [Rickettsiales bacterium]
MIYIYILKIYLHNDFSYKIVANSSSIDLPLYYKIFAPFATHEGSLFILFFIYILISYFFTYKIQKQIVKQEIFAFKIIASFNLLCIILFSIVIYQVDIFAKNTNSIENFGLNVLLQDYALLIHPPILYISYTLIIISSIFVFIGIFIFNCNNNQNIIENNLEQNNNNNNNSSSIESNKQDNKDKTNNNIILNNNIKLNHRENLVENNFELSEFLKRILNFIRTAWILNILAIALGSNWGYREFNWGGYWSYDPIEILSLIIFIILTGFYHVLLIAIKNQRLIKLSFLFAISSFFAIIFAFCISRAGILVSSHAFAINKINFVIFFYLFTLFLISFVFGIFKIKEINQSSTHKTNGIKIFAFVILLQIIVLLIAILMPIFYKAIFNLSINIDQDFFTYIFNPLIIPILILMSFFVKDKKIYHILKYISPIPIILVILNYYNNFDYLSIIYLFLCYLCIVISIIFMKQKISGMLISHIAFVLLIISIIFNKTLEKEFLLKV